jgi:branched-chain amino acid transport system substrate-binding protein
MIWCYRAFFLSDRIVKIGCLSYIFLKAETSGKQLNMATNEIRIGILATLIGPYAEGGGDGVRGVELAVSEFGGQVAGKKITLIKESTNAMPESAEMMADFLLRQHRVDFIIGPLSGNEGLAIRDYAKTRPDHAFINGVAGAQDITLRDAAPNFFSFTSNGVQWMSGLADYVYHTKGYKRVATLAEDYSYPNGQIAGFTLQYCKLGGKIVQKFWVPLGTAFYSKVIADMPADIDAIFVALGGADAVNFLKQYDQIGGTKPLIGGSITVDQTVLGLKGKLSDRLVGMVTSAPIADNNPDPAWQTFVDMYRKKFPSGLPSPSLFAWGYYVNTKAALLALHNVNGDLSDGQQKFMDALRKLKFNSPTGPVKLDHHQNAIGSIFINEVAKREDGSLYTKVVRTVTDVDQTLGIPEEEYLKIGTFSRDNPPGCA